MKKITILAAITFFLASCNFSTGVKKDLTSGLTTTNKGLSVEDVHLTDEANNILQSSNITLGKQLHVVATGVENYTAEGGKAYPGCSILLTDKANKEILNIADAFADLKEGASLEDAKTLTATVNTGSPMIVGETYKLVVTFFDKKNSENKITSKADIVMK